MFPLAKGGGCIVESAETLPEMNKERGEMVVTRKQGEGRKGSDTRAYDADIFSRR